MQGVKSLQNINIHIYRQGLLVVTIFFTSIYIEIITILVYCIIIDINPSTGLISMA